MANETNNFQLYDAPGVSPGRPRANSYGVRIYRSQYIYIGRDLVRKHGLNATGRVIVGLSNDRETLLIFPVSVEESVGNKRGLKLTHDTDSDRFKVYIGGFAREFNMPQEFYNTTDALRVSVTDYEGKKAILIKKPELLLSEDRQEQRKGGGRKLAV